MKTYFVQDSHENIYVYHRIDFAIKKLEYVRRIMQNPFCTIKRVWMECEGKVLYDNSK